mmetsp:Transcript_62497/g.167947  ORF Transcript_62497/g.167947 Transcript_62497/m.167947 type:complete len:246 (-) Transcript_62497:91-828(-)
MANPSSLPLVATGLGHIIMGGLVAVMFRQRWWTGDIMVQCGIDGRPKVDDHCTCGGTLPYICWLSEGINGMPYAPKEGQEPKIVHQSYIWVALATFPALSGTWLVLRRQRKLDVCMGLLSWIYLLVGLFPDTMWFLEHNAIGVLHFVCAFAGLGLAFILQFFVKPKLTVPLYIAFFVAINVAMICDGAEPSIFFDASFVALTLEWTFVVGSAAVGVTYCVIEHFSRLSRARTDSRFTGIALVTNA